MERAAPSATISSPLAPGQSSRTIAAPARVKGLESILSLSLLAGGCAVFLHGTPTGVHIFAGVALVFVLAPWRTSSRMALLWATMFLASLYVGVLFADKAVPIAVLLAFSLIHPKHRVEGLAWLRRGVMHKHLIVASLVIILIAAIALATWHHLAQPDLSGMRNSLGSIPKPMLPLLIAGYALVNAVLEETMFRGEIMQTTDAIFGAGHISVAVQGVVFGLVHYYGFPSGVMGASLAGIYGIMLGLLRRHAAGLLLPILVHIFADVVILTIVLLL